MLKPEDFRQLRGWDGKIVHIYNNRISSFRIEETITAREMSDQTSSLDSHLKLSGFDQDVLCGLHGEITRMCFKVLIRMARLMDAEELLNIEQAHVDGNWYGPASLAFGEKLSKGGAHFRVPTTLNALNVDQQRWRHLGVDIAFGEDCDQLARAFVQMGAQMSFTCAPYLLGNIPKLGDHIAWGESNAIIYANSVLGARTLKYSNMLDCLCAITGRAPKAGVYLDEKRTARLWIKAPHVQEIEDSFWPLLGYTIGALTANHIPAITGLEHLTPTTDDLKAFSAAFGTSSAAPMFHMVGITKEAPSLESVYQRDATLGCVELSVSQLRSCWDKFNQGNSPCSVDLISLGSPHLSIREIKKLAELCRERVKSQDVAIIATCGRAHYELASQAGYLHELAEFGIQLLTDTCWCFIEKPIIPISAKVIMTNSGKYAHYGPGLTGSSFRFGSLSMCIDAACSGISGVKVPPWLADSQNTATGDDG